MKALKWDVLMTLTLEEIRERYPWGAKQERELWRPAEEDEAPDRYLEDLEKAKEARQEKPRYLRQSYSVPRKYVKDPNAKGEENDNYTHVAHKAVRGSQGPEEPVSEEYQKHLTQEAHNRFHIVKAEDRAHAELRSVIASLRQIGKEAARSGMDPVQAVAMAANRMLEERGRKAA